LCQYNVGGSESFTTICASNDGYELKTVTTENFKGKEFRIEMAVFKINIAFATNKTWAASLDDENPEERRLGNKKCEPGDQETCCAGNGGSDKKENDAERPRLRTRPSFTTGITSSKTLINDRR
jgi:hypothetical protein